MRLLSARVTNYKRFRDTGTITFRDGMNVIVGQNDVGKTALVEALSLRAPSVPHRSILTLPESGMALDPFSRTTATFHLTSAEITRALATQGTVGVSSSRPEEDN